MHEWILIITAILSAAGATMGFAALRRDGRRIGALAGGIAGTVIAILSIATLLYLDGNSTLLIISMVIIIGIFLLGNLLGYPLLVIFLLWSGITVLRRESRSLGNALALLAGIGLTILPSTLALLDPPGAVQDDPLYSLRYGLHLAAVLSVGYLACVFAAYLGASLLYHWRKPRLIPEAVIVLGAGLIKGKVPPLLAGRLDKGLEVHSSYSPAPLLITSGGQGPDEPLPEGTAMRQYLLDRGAPSGSVIAEGSSRNTRENLQFSQKLLPSPHSPVIIVTSSFHVFRTALLSRALGMKAHVLGSRTVWYYLPSAVLREFAGVMRDRWQLHALSLAALLGLSALAAIFLVPAMVPPGA